MTGAASETSYRLFAQLLMVLTFLFGGLSGYVVGAEIGKQQAFELLEKGRLSVETSAKTSASKVLQNCYEQNLGSDRYASWKNGKGLTVDEVFKVLPCESLK